MQEERGGGEEGKVDGEDLRQVEAKDSTFFRWSSLVAAPVGGGGMSNTALLRGK